METIAVTLLGAVLNGTTFIGGSYLVKTLTGGSPSEIDAETKRHDLALEKYQEDLQTHQNEKDKYE